VPRLSLRKVLSGRRLTRLELEHELPKLQDGLLDAQFELRETRTRAVVMIVTGIPAAGRSEAAAELLEWLDQKLVTAHEFRKPNVIEAERPPLWRYWRLMPAKGRIAILFAGWYQELLREAVELDGDARKLPASLRRYVERIEQLERMLVADGVAVVKVHLHVAPETQRKRLRKLQRDKATRWRVTSEDRWMSRHYAKVERAFECCLDATQQAAAPWHLVDGTDSQHRALEVGRRLLDAIAASLPTQSSPRARHKRVPDSALTTAHRGPAPGDEEYDAALERLRGRLAMLSPRKRFAHHSVVAVFEGMDASGKGGAIRRITSALDARQYRVVPISARQPTRSRGLTCGVSGVACRHAATTRSLTAAGTVACWSREFASFRHAPIGNVPMRKSTSSSGN
jgi:AMP-polyphosphate phosphotransferase